ncbi:hypothetical protein [Polymorphobacter megasporae]|uniref:hypothetical protein n=1 Tax=Glacieibacterium megasporae TaxID=2835787 RepID=UPI001C1E329E|nr:hypothetical protein [Polymorphobacter megasporae]UAJ12405.1 hypothetical protein KTC28_21585 [Polymorphobacter megasporae]
MSSKLHQLSVYYPQHEGRALKAKAVAAHGSIGRYLKFLIEQDQASKASKQQSDFDRLSARLDEVLEFARYLMVIQNATAERLSPGLVAQVQEIYRKQFGEAPNAR